MSDLQKNLTAAGASAESAEKIAGIIKAAAQASALTPVELNAVSASVRTKPDAFITGKRNMPRCCRPAAANG